MSGTDTTVVFTAEEAGQYRLSGHDARLSLRSRSPLRGTAPRLATPARPRWMNVDGEWFLDNGEW